MWLFFTFDDGVSAKDLMHFGVLIHHWESVVDNAVRFIVSGVVSGYKR